MKALLPLLLLCACSVQPKPIVRTLDITVTSEINAEQTERIVNEALAHLRGSGVEVRTKHDCELSRPSGCVSVGIKRKQIWRSIVGLQGYYNPERNTILVYAGWWDRYNGRVLAHELGHALGCPHELLGLMHLPLLSSVFIWPFDGLDFATGFSDSCENIMTEGK